MSQSARVRLAYLVADTRTEVPFYRDLYSQYGRIRSMKNFEDLPIVTESMYSSGTLSDKLSSKASICISRTVTDSGGAGHVPRLLSYEDVIREHDVLHWFLEFVGESRRRNKLLVVATYGYRYCMAELGKMLAFYEWPLVAMTYSEFKKKGAISDQYAPTLVAFDSESTVPRLPLSTRCVLRLEEGPLYYEKACHKVFGILFQKLIGNIAIRRGYESIYFYNEEQFYLEATHGGQILLTSFVHRLQPLIRLALPLSGRILPGGRLFCES
jgi:hypothetical protein